MEYANDKGLALLERIAEAVEALAAGMGHVPKVSEPDKSANEKQKRA